MFYYYYWSNYVFLNKFKDFYPLLVDLIKYSTVQLKKNKIVMFFFSWIPGTPILYFNAFVCKFSVDMTCNANYDPI